MPNSVRLFVFLACFALAPAAAAQDGDPEVEKCTDAYSDCHDTCSLRYGVSTREDQRLKLGKCVDKCRRAETECRNRYFETKNTGIDPAAPKKEKEEPRPSAPAATAAPAADAGAPSPEAKKDEPQPKDGKKAEPDKKGKKKERSIEEWDPGAL